MIELPSASGITNFTSNAAGDVLHQMELGPRRPALSDLPGLTFRSRFSTVTKRSVSRPADMGAGMESLTPSIFAEILAASTGDQTTGVMLDVRDYGEVRAAEIKKFRR